MQFHMNKLLYPGADSPGTEASRSSLLNTQYHVHQVGITITYIYIYIDIHKSFLLSQTSESVTFSISHNLRLYSQTRLSLLGAQGELPVQPDWPFSRRQSSAAAHQSEGLILVRMTNVPSPDVRTCQTSRTPYHYTSNITLKV